MCLNTQNRRVEDVQDISAPKPIEELLVAAKTKISKPKIVYKFHHKVRCMTSGCGVCGGCKYNPLCVDGVSEWDETIP
jgi:hypothetical protein